MNCLFKIFYFLLVFLCVFSIPLFSKAEVETNSEINRFQDAAIQTSEDSVNQDIKFLTYTVSEGNTLLDIASKFRVTVKEIKTLNKIVDGNHIRTGQKLKIPKTLDRELFAQNENTNSEDIVESAELNNNDDSSANEVNRVEDSDDEEDKREERIKERTKIDVKPKVETNQGTSRPTLEVITPENNTQTPQGDIVNLQSEMELKDLIRTMSEITEEAFILDDTVKGRKVTIIAPQGGFKKQNALRMFETILDLNGFSVVNKDGVNKIIQKKDIKSQSIPTQVGAYLSRSSDRFITKILNLKSVRADEISNTLRPLVSKEGDIVVYPTSNTLIIIDTVDNVNRVVEIIRNLDVEKKIEFIKINNSVASEVAVKLLEIFGSSSGTTSSPTTQQRQTTNRRARGNQSNTSQPQAVTGQSDILGFKVITDERTNSLIVIAYPQDMPKIKKMINILDSEAEQVEQGIYVIRIKNADAEQMVGVLSSLIGGGSGGVGIGSNQRNINQGRANSGLGSARSGLGGVGGDSRQSISRQSGGGSISSLVAETDGLRITADPATNSIIVVGSRRDYETIKSVIDQLDIRRRQVFVEAAILEVGLDNITSFGTNFSLGFTVNDDTLGFGGQQLPGIPSLLGVAADSDNAINLVGSLSGLFLGVVGEEVDPDGSGPIPPIPSFSAIFQALASVTDVNVLSTPSILTTDNEEAEIVVADVIPFPTGSTVGNAGVTVQTIERLPVGIRLAITPQISEGDYLNLNIVTEVSNTSDAPTGLNTAQFGIATQTRSADSSVVVKDGQTIVIGGLVSDRKSILQNKTPILGDLPLIGNVFKFKQKSSQKRNLMILLTPRIVETDVDMQSILEQQQRRKMLLQERGLGTLEDGLY